MLLFLYFGKHKELKAALISASESVSIKILTFLFKKLSGSFIRFIGSIFLNSTPPGPPLFSFPGDLLGLIPDPFFSVSILDPLFSL